MPAPQQSNFYWPHALPSAQPFTSKHWRQKPIRVMYMHTINEIAVNVVCSKILLAINLLHLMLLQSTRCAVVYNVSTLCGVSVYTPSLCLHTKGWPSYWFFLDSWWHTKMVCRPEDSVNNAWRRVIYNALPVVQWTTSTLCLKKNDNDVLRYNCNAHQPILIIFGRDIAEWICY